jgi:hypothetical protein
LKRFVGATRGNVRSAATESVSVLRDEKDGTRAAGVDMGAVNRIVEPTL